MYMLVLNKIDYNQYAEGQDLEPVVVTTPVTIQVSAIRCFYARKQNRPGSRITFTDGGGFAVSETPDQIVALMIDCGATGRQMIAVAPQPEPVAAPQAVDTALGSQAVN